MTNHSPWTKASDFPNQLVKYALSSKLCLGQQMMRHWKKTQFNLFNKNILPPLSLCQLLSWQKLNYSFLKSSHFSKLKGFLPPNVCSYLIWQKLFISHGCHKWPDDYKQQIWWSVPFTCSAKGSWVLKGSWVQCSMRILCTIYSGVQFFWCNMQCVAWSMRCA